VTWIKICTVLYTVGYRVISHSIELNLGTYGYHVIIIVELKKEIVCEITCLVKPPRLILRNVISEIDDLKCL